MKNKDIYIYIYNNYKYNSTKYFDLLSSTVLLSVLH